MRVDVLGVGFDALTMGQALEKARELLDTPGGHYVVTPNSEIVVSTRGDEHARKALHDADLVLPDGVGVVKASRILGRPLAERVAGIDFAQKLMELCKGKRVYLLGAAEGVAQKAMSRLADRYPSLVFCGCRNGYFKDDAPVVDSVREACPDLLFVCLGAPRQEIWMMEHREDFGNCLMLGLGGCLDVWSGNTKRAPKLFIGLGLEWLYRLLTQPTRIGRMMRLPLFLLLVYRRRRAERKGESR